MGRFESLTALALGRTPYESTVIQPSPPASPHSFVSESDALYVQRYTARGRPVNARTRQRERTSIRAANEVLQVTGVVEYAATVKENNKKERSQRLNETFVGLRLVDLGVAVLIGGFWGVLGLRRRILLYKSYSGFGITYLITHEIQSRSLRSLILSGLPAVVPYHLLDWLAPDSGLTVAVGKESPSDTALQAFGKRSVRLMTEYGLGWVSLNLRTFAILQQLGMISGKTMLPSLASFIPFSSSSPLQLPPTPRDIWSMAPFAFALLNSAQPLVAVLLHAKFKGMAWNLLFHRIYSLLPGPVGNMFDDTSEPEERLRPESTPTEDEPTLRALEGLPQLGSESSDDGSDDGRRRRPVETLLSFEYEAADASVHSEAPYAATLRNPQPRPPNVTYKVTGMTLMPTIVACQGMTDLAAGLLGIPLEAAMVRVIGRAHRRSAGVGVADLWAPGFRLCFSTKTFENILAVTALQFVVTGVLWAGYTLLVDSIRGFILRRRGGLKKESGPSRAI